MEKHAAYQIKKRKDGRFSVVKRCGGYINGAEKTKILLDAKLITTKLPAEAPAEEEASSEAAPAESPAAEEAPAEG